MKSPHSARRVATRSPFDNVDAQLTEQAHSAGRPYHRGQTLHPELVRTPLEATAAVQSAVDTETAVQLSPAGPAWSSLGARSQVRDGVTGVQFAVWAPNACEVSVVSPGNGWTPGADLLWGSDAGVWSGFVAGMQPGDTYKYAIRTRDGRLLEKADPWAFQAELPPRTASVVASLGGYAWQDAAWLRRRAQASVYREPVSIYEVHPASWRRPDDDRTYFTWQELADSLIEYACGLGYTHLQLMPVAEYPFDGSWGYQVTGYFAPTSRFGSPQDFMAFVDACHAAGLGVLIDWVPGHFPLDAHGLHEFDGTSLYEHADPRQGFHPDWGTSIFNYGRTEVREFLMASARYWVETFHIDGLRVDAVASMLYLDYSRNPGEWIPNVHGGRENLEAISLLQEVNTRLHEEFPGILTIAEESTAWEGVSRPVEQGGLGFSMKWDMGWMNDTLRYLGREAVHRSHHQHELSFRMVYAFDENFVLPLSHDEVVHGKGSLLGRMPGDDWQQFAGLRLLYGYQYTTPGKKLLFMGGEFGQRAEWNHNTQLDWHLCDDERHAGIVRLVEDLNRVYRHEPALHQLDCDPAGFRWINGDDATCSVYSWVRLAENPDDCALVLLNCTPVTRSGYRVGVPAEGFYREILNTDAAAYGGSNAGNGGGMYAEPVPSDGQPASLVLTVPPLAVLVLKRFLPGL